MGINILIIIANDGKVYIIGENKKYYKVEEIKLIFKIMNVTTAMIWVSDLT